MSDKVQVNNNSLGLRSILTIIFVIAKLFHVVNWPWWVVFSPLIAGAVLTLFILAFVLIVVGVAVYLENK